MTLTEQLITIAVISFGTLSMRFLPYIIFPVGKPTPRFVQYLGKVLPGAVFAMLLIYCFRNISFISGTYGLPELIAVAVTVAVHLLTKQMTLSMALGTIVYMILVQFVFV